MTDEQLKQIKKHFDELYIAATGLNPNVPDEIAEAMKAAYVAGADYALEMFAPHWISVEDELPKPNSGMAVVVNYMGHLDFMKYCKSGWHNDKRWCLPKGIITRWMPLPQPPKEGGEE